MSVCGQKRFDPAYIYDAWDTEQSSLSVRIQILTGVTTNSGDFYCGQAIWMLCDAPLFLYGLCGCATYFYSARLFLEDLSFRG